MKMKSKLLVHPVIVSASTLLSSIAIGISAFSLQSIEMMILSVFVAWVSGGVSLMGMLVWIGWIQGSDKEHSESSPAHN